MRAGSGDEIGSEGARARARANQAKNDAQKGCAMQLKGNTKGWFQKRLLLQLLKLFLYGNGSVSVILLYQTMDSPPPPKKINK